MPAAAATLGAAMISNRATRGAAAQAAAGTAAGIAQRERFFEIGREQLAPYREIGNDAVDKIRSVFLEGNMDEFYDDPSYKFNLEQGEQALERKQGQGGARYGGKAIKEALKFSQGLASGEFNNFFNRLKSLADMGGNAAAGVANTANSVGSDVANMTTQGATNQANLTMQHGQSMNQALQGGLSNYSTMQAYNNMLQTLQPNQPVQDKSQPVVAGDANQPAYNFGRGQ